MIPQSHKLSILNWNARGVRDSKFDLFEFLISSRIKVACITETKLDNSISFSNQHFSIYRLDYTGGTIASGGVAIAVHKSVKSESLPSFNTEQIQAIGCKVFARNGRHLNVIAAYFTGTTTHHNYPAFRRDLRRLTRTANTIILGDFNARHQYWGCSSSNQAGKYLFEEYSNGSFEIMFPDSPTYYPGGTRLPSVLDLMLTTSNYSIEPLSVLDELNSDHHPVLAEIDCNTERDNTYNVIQCFSKANWPRFKRIVSEKINLSEFQLSSSCTTSDIDDRVEKITKIIRDATSTVVPTKRIKYHETQLSTELLSLIRLRRAKKRLYRRSGLDYIRREYNFIGKRIENLMKKAHNERFQEKVSEFIPNVENNRKLWALSKVLRGKKSKIPVLRAEDKTLVTEQEKAECLAGKFAENHNTTLDQPVTKKLDKEVNQLIARLRSSAEPNTDPRTLTSPSEVSMIIRRLKNSKAPGADLVRNAALKNGGKKLIVALTYIFNACLFLSYFPTSWKSAITVPVPKPGKKPSSPESYRPISLLSALSKVFEKIVLLRLQKHIELNRIIPDTQYGFRAGHSTSHLALRLKKAIKGSLQSKPGQSTGLVLFDLKAAFDTLWHNGLVLKMESFGFPTYLLKLIDSFLSDRSFKVKVGNKFSSANPVPAGVPQGAALSPTLFNIFVSDLPALVATHIGQFADDIAIWWSSRRAGTIRKNLQNSCNKVGRFLKKWKLKLNPSKTESVFFTRRRAAHGLPRKPLKVEGHNVPWSTSAKYLGIHFDKTLTFERHIRHAIDKSGKCTRALYSLLGRGSKLHTQNKLLLFKAVIRPIMLYGSPVWGNCADTHLQKLQVAQNRCLKMCLKLPPRFPTAELHKRAEIEQIKPYLLKLKTAFIERCPFIDNPLVMETLETLHLT